MLEQEGRAQQKVLRTMLWARSSGLITGNEHRASKLNCSGSFQHPLCSKILRLLRAIRCVDSRGSSADAIVHCHSWNDTRWVDIISGYRKCGGTVIDTNSDMSHQAVSEGITKEKTEMTTE